ncbi:MAG: type IV pilus assembly protein PilV [Oceanicoccus sp.]|jgi:type IV pilus assembly protein PilV
MGTNMRNKLQQRGLTLIEVMITLVIMSVGLLGLAGLQSTSIKDGLDIGQRSQATWLANEIAERMRANNTDPMSYDAAGANVAIASCSATPARDCTSSSCNTSQMAAFDIWEVVCGTQTTDVLSNAGDSISLTTLDISCSSGLCNNNGFSDFDITLSWTAKTVDNSQLLTTAAKTANQTRRITITLRP